MLAAEISRGSRVRLDDETRQAALNLLTAPANRLSEKLNRLLSTSTERRLGCHVLIDETMVRLELLFVAETPKRTKVDAPPCLSLFRNR